MQLNAFKFKPLSDSEDLPELVMTTKSLMIVKMVLPVKY